MLLFAFPAMTQSIEESVIEKIISEDDTEITDALEEIKKHPLDLNSVTEAELKIFRIVTEMQIHQFMVYRKTFGPFIDIHELQAIPLWDPAMIRELLPYVRIGNASFAASLLNRIKHGEHSFLLRTSRTMETAAGYKVENGFAGSREKFLLKHKYRFRNLLQYGFTAEKDAGEKLRPDLLSFHLFIRNAGKLRALAIGDFSVNLGQGLIQYHSMSAGKTSDVMFIKQQSEALRPYTSSSEYNFNRGVGVTVGENKWESTAFFSMTRLSATTAVDPASGLETITSISSTGLHRTAGELEIRRNTDLTSAGMGLEYRAGMFRMGINGVMHRFSRPLMKNASPYNFYDPEGNIQRNVSTDFSYTRRNAHGFGEFAMDLDGGIAVLGGLMASLHPNVDASILFRKVAPGYHALNGNAFLESGDVSDETGLYTGICIRPEYGVSIQAYADLYGHRFLRYRKSAPSRGRDWFLQGSYQPGKKTSIYVRYHQVLQEQDMNTEHGGIRGLTDINSRKWRLHYIYTVSPYLRIQARTEAVWWQKGDVSEDGFLIYLDMTAKAKKALSLTVRLLTFETSGFESRIYTYEPDVPFAASIPFFSEKGHRYLIIARADLSKDLGLSIKWSQTIHTNKTTLGTGLDETLGNTRSDLRVQLVYTIRGS